MKPKSIVRAPFRVAVSSRRLAAIGALVLAGATGARSEIRFDGPRTIHLSRAAIALAAADFDENGAVDLAVVSFFSDSIALFRGDGSGSFAFSRSVPVGRSPSDLVSADADSDGHADLVVVNFDGRSLSVLLGDGAGAFRSNTVVPIAGSQPKSLIARDFDLDGRMDLAVVQVADVAVLLGDGAGGFAPAVALGVPATSDVMSVDSGDFDEDGFLDLTVLALDRDVASPFRDRPSDVFILRGDGSGGFALTSQFNVAPIARGCVGQVVSDLDGDGHVDIAVLDRNYGLFTFRGDGTGGFAASGNLYTGGTNRTNRPIVADFSGDGLPDVAVGSDFSGMMVLENDGVGGFFPGVPFATLRYPTAMTAADCDGDARLDVAVSIGDRDFTTGALQVFTNGNAHCLRSGNVNAGRGAITDVLFVNDSAGGPRREIRVLRHVPFRIFVATPPAATGPAPFAAFVTIGAPDASTSRDLPLGIGKSCLPMLASHGEPRPRAVFNNTGRLGLGAPTHPSTPAPSQLVSRPSGLGRAVTFFVQGVIADPGSAALRPASLTNGVLVICD